MKLAARSVVSTAMPELTVLRSLSLKCLLISAFKERSIYQNTMGDVILPFPSGLVKEIPWKNNKAHNCFPQILVIPVPMSAP